MKLKVKVLRQIISMLCAISMSTSVLINSVGAIDTNDAEAAFSMRYMNSLPKPGEVDFDRFSGEYELDKVKKNKYTDTLQNERTYDVKYPKGYNGFEVKEETIDEKKEYEEIKQLVEKLKQKVKDRTPAKDLDDETIQTKILGGQISKHYKMPEEMRLAKAIYRWVAKKISYDYDSLKKAGEIMLIKPQDALYVFAKRTGVCAGKANLTNLMMRMAGIPSAVIVSRTHAFNAIYLKDTVNNREGWTLIDSTWAAPASDMSLQTGQKSEEVVVKNKKQEKINKEQEKINKMIKGTENMELFFARKYFAMTDEYARQINDMVYIDSSDWKKMNGDDIEKFNKELERKLKELNNTKSGPNGFKFKKIRVFRDKNRKCLVEYETNVEQDKAEEFYKYVRQQHIEIKAKDVLKMTGGAFSKKGFEGVNDKFVEVIKDINKLNNRSNLTISKEYCKEFQIFYEDLLKKHKEELINNINILRTYWHDKENAEEDEKKEANSAKLRVQNIINDMNTTIKSKVEMLNGKYQDVVKIKDFEIFWEDSMIDMGDGSSAVSVNMELDLPFDDAVKAINKRYDWSKMQKFFPGFYDKTLAFEHANEDIIDYRAHKFDEIVFGDLYNDREKSSVFNLQVDGVTYRLDMFSGEGALSKFELTGNEKNPLENVKILPDILNFGVPFEIGSGIKSLTLQGNEKIKFGDDSNVERINADKSTRYYADGVALYTRNKDGSVGNIEEIFRKSGNFGGIEFEINYEKIDGKIQIEGVEVYDLKNIRQIPKFLTEFANRFNVSIKIKNIEEYKKKQAEKERLERKNKIQNEYDKMAWEFYKENIVFNVWENMDQRRVRAYESSQVITTVIETVKLYRELRREYNFEKAEEFIGLAKKAIEEMKKFKEEYAQKEKLRKEKLRNLEATLHQNYQTFVKKENDFRIWAQDKKINYEDIDAWKKKGEVTELYEEIKDGLSKLNEENVNKFIQLAKKVIKDMKKFKKEYEQKEYAQKEKLRKEKLGNLEATLHQNYQTFVKKEYGFLIWAQDKKINYEDIDAWKKKGEVTELYEEIKDGLSKLNEENVNKFIQLVKKVIEDLEKFKKEYEQKEYEQKERLEGENKIQNEYKKIEQELYTENSDFSNWKKSDNGRIQAYEKSKVKTTREEAINLYRELQREYNFEKAEKFITLAKKAIEEMKKFKEEYEQKEYEQKEKLMAEALKKYEEKKEEFDLWAKNEKIEYRNTDVWKKIAEITELKHEIVNDPSKFNKENVNKFIQLADEAIKQMDGFMAGL